MRGAEWGRVGAPRAAGARCRARWAGPWSALPRYCLSRRGHFGCGLVSVGNRPSRLLRLPALAFGSGQALRQVYPPPAAGDRTGAWRHAGWCLCQLARWELLLSPHWPPGPRLPLPTASHGWQWDAGAWLICGTLVMRQQREPSGDSEGLCWVAAGAALAPQMSCHPGEVMLWVSRSRSPLDLWLMPCHLWASREPVSTDQPTLVTWRGRDTPVQLTGRNPPHCCARVSCVLSVLQHQDRTMGATTPRSCSAPASPWAHVLATGGGGGQALGLVLAAHYAEWKPGLCPPHSLARSPPGRGYF